QGAVISCPEFKVGAAYHVYVGGGVQGTETDGLYNASTVTGFTGAVRQQYTGTDVGRGPGGGMRPNGMPDGERPEGGMRPEGEMMRPERPEGDMVPPDGARPDGDKMNGERPEGWMPGMRPDGEFGGMPAGNEGPASVEFYMTDKVNAFSGVTDETGSKDETTDSIKFADVSNNAYYSEAVRWAVEQGIASGTGSNTFSPNANCTCAQILTFLWRAAGSPDAENDGTLAVRESDYYYQAALWAREQGLIETFEPGSPCTRGTAVYFLWRASGSPAAADTSFTDVPAGADYAQAVAWAAENGVASGTAAGTFSPDAVCTRGQTVTFLHRAFAE
ncbi:MAG: S-layer homology domain-containing protein, partial [Oscillospiraceae bacterium]|nr:S-layer homology domain-containing protein [Oscillospiraceae bacterium]